MNEKDLVKNIIQSGFLENQFGRKTIQNIYNEFSVGNNKNVDIAVETLDFLYLIEVKVNLVSYDIGQIMVYMTSMKHDTFKRIKGILMYDSISEKETQLIYETIKDFNIDVSLIKFSGVNVSPKKTNENQELENEKLTLNEKIDEYIILNYVSGQKINVSQLKKEFGFKAQDRNWADKIRPHLKTCFIDPKNNRLTRTSIDKKDKIKLVK